MRKIVLMVFATFCVCLTAFAEREINGKVVYELDGEPLIGATVMPVGGGGGTATDFDGNFTIKLQDGVSELNVSYVGMMSQTVAAVDGMIVKMTDSSTELDEVVVTAFGMKRDRKALGYAVQDLKSDELNTRGTTDLANAINGKISGVDIRPSSGMPGASTNIVIRGARSFEQSNQPLYVIDGMPVSTESDFRNYNNDAVSGTTYSQRAIDINPEDIESINVLKGQAAAALYGIRASNGVIVITTKRGSGEKGKPKVTLSSNFSADVVSRQFKHQSDYAQGVYGSYSPSNSMTWGPEITQLPNDPNYGGNVANKYNGGDTQKYAGMYYNPTYASAGYGDGSGWIVPTVHDNVSDFFGTGFTENTTVNISQNLGEASYSFSLSNAHQDGVVPSTGMDRWGARGLVDWTIAPEWKTGFSVNYTSTKINSAPVGNSGIINVVYTAPAEYDLAGVPYHMPGDPSSQTLFRSTAFNNPYWWAENNEYLQHSNRVFGNAYLEYRPKIEWANVTDFHIREQAGLDVYTNDNSEVDEYGSASYSQGNITNKGVSNNTFNNLLTASLSARFGDDWALDVMVGNEINHEQQRQWEYTGTGFNFYGMPTISNATSFTSSEVTYAERTIGVFGSANLSWKDMLYLSVTGRNDWLSSMPRGSRSFFYPSVSLSWVFTQLPKLNNNQVLTFGKLRTSFAQVGQAGGYMDNFYYTPVYGSGMYMGYPLTYPFNGVGTYVPYFLAYDENLKPQNTKNVEVGVDLVFFNDRLRLDYTYSYQDVTDQIMQVPQAGSSGYQSMLTNGGEILTHSHEINLSATLYENKDWNVDLGVSFTKVHNYVKELANGVESIMLTGYATPQIRAERGSTYPIIYGIGFARDPQGRIIYEFNEDYNSYVPAATANDINLGECSPNFNMGFNLNIRYKRVSLSSTWSYQNGGKMYSGTMSVLNMFGATQETADARRNGGVEVSGVINTGTAEQPVYEEWTGTVDAEAYYTKLGDIAEAAVYDTSFLKLRDLTLNYDLPRIGNFDITVYGFARNILVWAKMPEMDPESTIGNNNGGGYFDNYSMPQTMSLGGGFKFSF